MATISQGMTYVLAAGMLVVAARTAVVPRKAAAAYGIPLPEDTAPTPYLETKVNRDVVLSALVVVAASAGSSVLARALFLATLAPVADAWNVRRHATTSATAIHLETAAFMLVAGALAAAGH